LNTADRALVSLHPHDLAAVDAQAHVAAGQDHGVLCRRVADDALFLRVVSQVGLVVVGSVDFVEVHNLIVVEQLLLQELEPQIVGSVLLEGAVGVLNILAALAHIVLRVDRLDGYHNRVEVVFLVE